MLLTYIIKTSLKRSLSVFASILLLLTSTSCANTKRIINTCESNRLQQQIDSISNIYKADIGVAIYYHGSNICLKNAEKRFPMMSVFKLHQAVAILDSLNHDTSLLAKEIAITPEMLHPDTYSPLRENHPNGNINLSIETLLHYTLWQSDNNACDILFNQFGGTKYADQHIKALGLLHTQIKWDENEMHTNSIRCYDNYTTPIDAIKLIEYAYNCIWLRECLTKCKTGGNRLPALLPQSTIVGHKIGTGDTTPDNHLHGINDVGFVMLPNGEHFSIAVFCDDSQLTMQETEAIIAKIDHLTYQFIIDSIN